MIEDFFHLPPVKFRWGEALMSISQKINKEDGMLIMFLS
jgi:hypothetical protein